MSKPIAEMSDAQISVELSNYERYRLSSDPARVRLFEKNRPRYGELLAANEARTGFKLKVSLKVIQQAARESRFISYKDIADANGIEWTKAYRTIGTHLWDLVRWSHGEFGFMISSVIVNKENLAEGTMESATLAGFVKAAEDLKFRVNDPAAFLKEQQALVFAQFAGS